MSKNRIFFFQGVPMTAEVVVMNRKGVALAADSAGTLSSRGLFKVYNSNDKLFQISNKCHIGSLTYGDSGLNGAPFELIIGRFKEKHSDTIWKTVNESKQAFIQYLNGSEFATYSDEKYYVHSRINDSLKLLESDLASIKDDIRHLYFIDRQLSKLNPKTDEEKIEQLHQEKASITERLDNFNESNYIEYNLDQIKQTANCETIDNTFFHEISDTYGAFIAETLNNCQTGISPDKFNLVIEYCIYSMFKYALRDGGMGVAFAGFGSDEFYPSCTDIMIYGTICGKTIYRNMGEFKISTDKPMYILPLAQTENVDTFVFGISPTMENILRDKIGEFFNEAISKFGQALSDEDAFIGFGEERLVNALSLAQDSIEKDFDNLLNSIKIHNRKNIYDALNWLSIPDMAQMAKSLVELTAFKKKMSVETDTVGGPIDVAVISKNDGFNWIEKKSK